MARRVRGNKLRREDVLTDISPLVNVASAAGNVALQKEAFDRKAKRADLSLEREELNAEKTKLLKLEGFRKNTELVENELRLSRALRELNQEYMEQNADLPNDSEALQKLNDDKEALISNFMATVSPENQAAALRRVDAAKEKTNKGIETFTVSQTTANVKKIWDRIGEERTRLARESAGDTIEGYNGESLWLNERTKAVIAEDEAFLKGAVELFVSSGAMTKAEGATLSKKSRANSLSDYVEAVMTERPTLAATILDDNKVIEILSEAGLLAGLKKQLAPLMTPARLNREKVQQGFLKKDLLRYLDEPLNGRQLDILTKRHNLTDAEKKFLYEANGILPPTENSEGENSKEEMALRAANVFQGYLARAWESGAFMNGPQLEEMRDAALDPSLSFSERKKNLKSFYEVLAMKASVGKKKKLSFGYVEVEAYLRAAAPSVEKASFRGTREERNRKKTTLEKKQRTIIEGKKAEGQRLYLDNLEYIAKENELSITDLYTLDYASKREIFSEAAEATIKELERREYALSHNIPTKLLLKAGADGSLQALLDPDTRDRVNANGKRI